MEVVRYLSRGDGYELDGVVVHPGRPRLEDLLDGADVLVCHAGDDGRAAVIAGTVGVPVVRLVHGTSSRVSLDGAVLVVCNSQSTAKQIGWDGPLVVCRPPFNPDDFRTTPGDRVTLVNLSAAKGAETFWLAAAALPDVRFLGVRGGYGAQVMRSRENVEVVRRPTKDMRGDVYSRTRVLLMPSEFETWGMVGVEAMCSGIPVIAHPTPGLVESLGCAGAFVDRGDLAGWCREITRLQDPQEWDAASRVALARSRELAAMDDSTVFAEAIEALA